MAQNITSKIKPDQRHILAMTDQFGFMQFAKRTAPDKRFGYSIDDQARALILSLMWDRQFHDSRLEKIAGIYLKFIEQAIEPDGFHNFFGINHRRLKEVRSQDAIGRTFWALGYAMQAHLPKVGEKAQKIFDQQLPVINRLEALRSQAFTLLGLCYYKNSRLFSESSQKQTIVRLAKSLANNLVQAFESVSRDGWRWFEDRLVYSNAILPWSLLIASETLHDRHYFEIGQKSFDWLHQVSQSDGKPAPIGADGWYEKGKKKALFRQQPIDVADMVIVASELFKVTYDNKYGRWAIGWFDWFLGNNLLGITLYDKNTGGCRDGLFPKLVNPNEGAESTIMFWMAYLVLRNASIASKASIASN